MNVMVILRLTDEAYRARNSWLSEELHSEGIENNDWYMLLYIVKHCMLNQFDIA